MAAIRSAGNRTETALRRALHSLGLRYRKYVSTLEGRPDVVFARNKVAVFIDGDYWHGRLLREKGVGALRRHYTPKQQSYWIPKMKRNVARDERVNATLRAAGWTVLRFWESDVRADLDVHAQKIARRVASVRRAARGK